jgi:hypothetical protein
MSGALGSIVSNLLSINKIPPLYPCAHRSFASVDITSAVDASYMHVIETARHLTAAMIAERPYFLQRVAVEDMNFLACSIRNVNPFTVRRE